MVSFERGPPVQALSVGVLTADETPRAQLRDILKNLEAGFSYSPRHPAFKPLETSFSSSHVRNELTHPTVLIVAAGCQPHFLAKVLFEGPGVWANN